MLEMTELNDLAYQIVDILKKHIGPHSEQLWDAEDCAAYLRCTARQVTDRYSAHPSFPEPVRLPTDNANGRGHPRWYAVEVIAWVRQWKVKSSIRQKPLRTENPTPRLRQND